MRSAALKMGVLLGIIAVLFAASISQAVTESWAKAYSDIDPEETVRVVNLNGDSVLLGNSREGVVIARITENGEVAWSKLIKGDYDLEGEALEGGPDGHIIIGGSVGDGRGVWLAKLDENGKVVWSRVYLSLEGKDLVAIGVDGDGNVFGLVGLKSQDEYLVFKLDPSGSLEWVRRYKGTYDLKLVKIEPLENDYLLLAGNRGKSPAVAVLSPGGVVMWGKVYGIYSRAELRDVAITDDGIILVGNVESGGGEKGFLVKLRPNGAVASAETYSWGDVRLSIERVLPGKENLVLIGTATRIFNSGDIVVLLTDGSGKIKEQAAYTAPLSGRVLDASPGDETLTIAMRSYLNTSLAQVALLTLDPGAMPRECRGCRDSNVSGMQASISISSDRFLQPDQPSVPPLVPDSTGIQVSKFPLRVSGSVILGGGEMKAEGINTAYIIGALLALVVIGEVVAKAKGGKSRKKPKSAKVKAEEKPAPAQEIRAEPRKPAPKPVEVKKSKAEKPEEPAVPEVKKPDLPEPPVPGFPPALLSRYEPLEFIGEGGFAKVFKVKRKKDGKVVSLKIPRIDERTSKTFIKEVSAWLHLSHENIARLYDVDILPIPYLEMEYVEGVKLNGKTVRDLDGYPKPLDEKTALKLIKGIADGLKHAHGKGIYHRDLKPLNILLKADLTPKITDWGLAKLGTMSSSRSVLGYTPLYASPEHLMPSKYGHTDHRTDIWQLGVTFYELLTGKLPFEGYTYEEVFGKIVDENYKFTPPSKINPGLAKYDGIFEKLLAKRKEDRYQSVEEFLKGLEILQEVEKRKVELEKEVEELKKSLARSLEALKRSKTAEETLRNRRIVVETLGKLALTYAELNRKAELLNTLNDLKFYTVRNLTDLTNAISTVEILIKENVPISDDFMERLKVLVHNIKRENGA
ncbi:serine/threonine-protein kinase [Thermococcus indicus]|uniref:serine/threonine-protein kinase n=1 Tax=Thermococcus indicus TaxID=2586643 RepID=UPI001F1187FD|nr:serine/threonine-protein kinase [Thermococcus indicus]